MMLAAFEPGSEEPGIETTQAAGYRLVDALDHPAELADATGCASCSPSSSS